MRLAIEILLILVAFGLGIWIRRLLGGALDRKVYGKRRTVIEDAETDDSYDFFENEGFGDDGKKPGSRGQPVAVGGVKDRATVWGTGDQLGLVSLDEIECGRIYYVTREKFVDKGNDKTCGGPDAFQAEYNAVKDEVLRLAVRVADRCKRQPSCQAVIDFQESFTTCVPDGDPPQFVLQVRYQVRVNCFTL